MRELRQLVNMIVSKDQDTFNLAVNILLNRGYNMWRVRKFIDRVLEPYFMYTASLALAEDGELTFDRKPGVYQDVIVKSKLGSYAWNIDKLNMDETTLNEAIDEAL